MSASSFRAAALALAALAWQCGAHAQQGAPEHAAKAALVFHFAVFTSWPAEALPAPGEPFVLCYADERMTAAFASLSGKTVHGRRLAARRLAAGAAPEGCHVGYWPAQARVPPGSDARRSTLLVAESAGFAGRGGMIELDVEDARMAFEVNVDSTRAAGLRPSSKLLRLARKVHGHVDD
ncbi:MAG TPA: YfiR family protein [Burkholderiales bacterium]|nr:YfiR family protein [Burkholderiales bacterium]